MSEPVTSQETPKRSYTKIIVAVVSALILLIIYGAGSVILPVSIKSNHQGRDCDSVLSLNKIYRSMYPAFVQDINVSNAVSECEAYVLVVAAEEGGAWMDAYDGYQAYSKTYPDGLYVKEAHQQSAAVLMNLAKDQVEQKKYSEAVTNLDLIHSDFSDTSAAADALTLFPSLYTSWGGELREAGDFEGAERVFNDFKAWAQNNSKSELDMQIRDELAQTYVAWGLSLQSQNQFQDALARLDMAISMDSEFTTSAKADKVKVHIDWGNDLVEQKEFTAAVEKFNTAVSLSDGATRNDAGDALANGYIAWASDLSAGDDFQGALAQLDVAKTSAATDTVKQSVETTLQDVYLAFSKSSGEQAQRAMRQALIAVCEKGGKPELPILGLSTDSFRVGIHGVKDKLPEDLVPRTPAEMHSIACVEESSLEVGRADFGVLVKIDGRSVPLRFSTFRMRIIWNISLRRTSTGDEYDTFTLEGGVPPPFPKGQDLSSSSKLYGTSPDINDLAEWLKSAIQNAPAD